MGLLSFFMYGYRMRFMTEPPLHYYIVTIITIIIAIITIIVIIVVINDIIVIIIQIFSLSRWQVWKKDGRIRRIMEMGKI